MAQENELSALQEQLKALQLEHRKNLSSRYGLDDASASAIPLGTAGEMENAAKLLQQAAGANAPANSGGVSAGTPSGKAPFSRTIRATVDSLLSQKYRGPANRSE